MRGLIARTSRKIQGLNATETSPPDASESEQDIEPGQFAHVDQPHASFNQLVQVSRFCIRVRVVR